ncbi:MAG: zf-TFIIB domain-containing protein [Alphaproteobacteria bacterium]|nr:zf-TFIIB domain-containing protein [Alphaproteobacteria bacterium]MCB9697721.1 zf-TFIIB domain-containing protein [Alphaproteobacteria bacterium]
MRCPRCGTDDLVQGRYHKVPLSRCDKCGGVYVEIKHNVHFLDALAKDLAAEVNLDTEIPPHEGQDAVALCPRCSGAMERFGYLGTNRVYLDRCGRCMALWHDGDELGTTAALHARTTMRLQSRAVSRREDEDDQERRLHSMMMSRIAMSRGFTMGGF